MKISQILAAVAAYISGKGSFRFGARTVTLQNTGTGPVKFTLATALAAVEQAALLESTTGTLFPQTIVVGSTSITVS